MTKPILKLHQAKPILEPIHENLMSSVRSGFDDWVKIRDFAGSLDGGPLAYKPRTKAGIIHDHIEKYIRSNFEGLPDINVDDYNGIFGMLVQGSLFLRFKKMDDTYSIKNFPTVQHKNYINQQKIDAIPDSPTYLFVGYVPDKTWSRIKGIYIACWMGDSLEWVDQDGVYTFEQAELDFESDQNLFTETERRIKVKKTGTGPKNTGTNN